MKLKSFLHYLNRRDTRLIPKKNTLIKLLLFFTIISGSFLLTKNILALTNEEGSGDMSVKIDTTEFVENYLAKQKAIDDGNNLESWIYESLSSNAGAMNKALAGNSTEETFTNAGYIPGGLIGFTNNSIATLYNPPASGIEYIAQTVNSFMGKPAYAANGFGFNQLNGILTIWKTFRNAIYVLISLFFIIIGIMIMLRIKISPQATMTVQTTIPKIVTTLILVTFSYAIAGLLIDFSYVIEGIVLSIINSSINLQEVLKNNVHSVSGLMSLNLEGFSDIVYNSLLPNVAIGWLAGSSAIITGVVIAHFSGTVLLGILAGSLLLLVIYLVIFIQIVKLFFGLAKCYINIIFKIIISPLEIGLGVFPGSKVNFSSWIIGLIANLSVFPASIIFLVMAVIFRQAIIDSNFWTPSMFGNGNLFSGLIGIASIFILAKIPQIVPEFIFKIKPSPINKMVSDSASGILRSKKLKGVGEAVGSSAKVGFVNRHTDSSTGTDTFGHGSPNSTLANMQEALWKKWKKQR